VMTDIKKKEKFIENNLRGKSILVYDIETDSTHTGDANFKYGGFYSYKTGELGITKDIKTLKHQIKNHKYLVTFNGKRFDNPILEKYNISFYNKIHIDMWEMLADRFPFRGKGRGKLIRGDFNEFSLNACLKYCGIPVSKGILDYKLLKKKNITDKEEKLIIHYTKKDIEITCRLYEFLEEFFLSLTEYMTQRSIERKEYLTASTGSIAYKVICKLAKLPEVYSEAEHPTLKYEGGYVSLPSKSEAKGIIYCLDFASLYPHMFMIANLFTPVHKCKHKVKGKCPNPYSGGEFFKLKGTYCGCEFGTIEKVIKYLYDERVQLKKKKDKRQLRNKIIINSMYGISASPNFESIYYEHTASDCTRMGRTCTKFARQIFMQYGYIVLYSDTDSIYLLDPFNDKLKLDKIKKFIIKNILKHAAFPLPTFDLDYDFEIEHIWFFENPMKLGEYKKKHYAFIYKDCKKTKGGKICIPKLKLKGLPIVKRNATHLSKYTLETYLMNNILIRKDINFPKDLIMRYIEFEINRDYTQLGIQFNVNSLKNYKSPNQLQAQIGRYIPRNKKKPLGEGKHIMIRNSKIGVGIGLNKYCTIEEAKELRFHHYDISQVLKELSPFIKKDKQMKIESWFGEKENV